MSNNSDILELQQKRLAMYERDDAIGEAVRSARDWVLFSVSSEQAFADQRDRRGELSAKEADKACAAFWAAMEALADE